MRDRVSGDALANGAIPYRVFDANGTQLRREYFLPDDAPTQQGDALNKANLLKDQTAARFGLGADAVPDDVLALVIMPQIIVTVPNGAGSTVTCTQGQIVLPATEQDGSWIVNVPQYGEWVVTATLGEESVSETVVVDAAKQYSLELWYLRIYGALWDGTSTTSWARTDRAADFIDPVPYVSGASAYSSPFDTLMPWSGMTRVSDAEAGELVAIPKFWYKWTKTGATMQLQIADSPVAGFYVSPAHADRGDGIGERDIAYVGRYHCGDTAYKSASGQVPKTGITRATARRQISALGSDVWQYDFAMYWTIAMLYIVEFSDWDSQSKIGYGRSVDGSVMTMGYTDSMPYHTGTTEASRTTYGGTQYRYVEGIWDNAIDWCDGVYVLNGDDLYCINKPSSFSDNANGRLVAEIPMTNFYTATWVVPTHPDYGYALYPSGGGGSESTYVCDYSINDNRNYADSTMRVGGGRGQDRSGGMFYFDGVAPVSWSGSDTGCRLVKLPS